MPWELSVTWLRSRLRLWEKGRPPVFTLRPGLLALTLLSLSASPIPRAPIRCSPQCALFSHTDGISPLGFPEQPLLLSQHFPLLTSLCPGTSLSELLRLLSLTYPLCVSRGVVVTHIRPFSARQRLSEGRLCPTDCFVSCVWDIGIPTPAPTLALLASCGQAQPAHLCISSHSAR